MQEVLERRRIPAALPTVWQVYTDHVGWGRWAGIGTVRLARTGDPPPNGVGCVRVISRLGISVHEEILSFEPPRRMTYTILRGGLPIKNHHGEVDFEADGTGTLVTWRCRFDSKVPGLGGLWKIIVTKVFRDTLAALERYPFGREARA